MEAKKLTIGPQNVLTQAERYACWLRETTCKLAGDRLQGVQVAPPLGRVALEVIGAARRPDTVTAAAR